MAALQDIEFDQTRRLISVEAFHLGPKKLMITAFEGVEKLSALSGFRLEIVTKGRSLNPGEMLGKPLTLALRHRDKIRKFSGIIGGFQQLHTSMRDYRLQTADLVPPAWLLTLNQRCRIFSDKKSTDVVSQVFGEANIASRTKSAGAVREYIVQYLESDFSFASRLLEEEGLFYYFDHGEQNCPIVLGNGAADYSRAGPAALDTYQEIETWQPHYRIGASSFKHGDWDFKAVNVMEGTAKGLGKVQTAGLAERAFYEFPGRYAASSDGTALARSRMEEHEVEFVRVHGVSHDIGVAPGTKFKTSKNKVALLAPAQETDSHAVVSVEHVARDGAGLPFDIATNYQNNFECIPSDLNFRPPRTTRRPVITGPHTAIVTDGPDEYGRARVKFPWDEENQSRWARVAQNWAYNQMGTQFLPRKDSEVVVEFLDGDPDYPLIVGMVYNGKNKLPFSVPGNKTQSGIRGANWDSAGTADKSNELRFEDKAGSEEIYINAQKDFRRVVYHDDLLTVDTGDRTLHIKQGNVAETLDQGNKDTRLKTGDQSTTLDMGNQSTTLKAGDHSLKLNLGASNTDAMQSITLKVGGSSIVLDQTGVTIKGIMIKIEANAMLDAKSPMTQVNGDGMLILKGGITLIN